MTTFLIGIILGLIIGVFIGAWIVSSFDVPNAEINGKFKPKNGANININNEQNGTDSKPLARTRNRIAGIFKNRGKFNP